MSDIYADRATICLINVMRARLGDRLAQTNSRFNGRFVNAVRVYSDPAHRGHVRQALACATDRAELAELALRVGRGDFDVDRVEGA